MIALVGRELLQHLVIHRFVASPLFWHVLFLMLVVLALLLPVLRLFADQETGYRSVQKLLRSVFVSPVFRVNMLLFPAALTSRERNRHYGLPTSKYLLLLMI